VPKGWFRFRGGAPGRAGPADSAADLVERGELRCLGDLVDDAAGRAAPEQDRRRALQDLDRLQVAGVAGILAEIPHPVDEDVVTGREAPEGEVVALAAAALAGGERHAGHGTERVAQDEERTLLHDLLGDDRDGLRRVVDRVRQLVEARLLDLELVVLVALALDVDAGQRHVLLGRFRG
jgi:hypothetical protein